MDGLVIFINIPKILRSFQPWNGQKTSLIESVENGELIMMDEKYHTAFGVYGIYQPTKDKLLVIKKNSGPYSRRFDLPGGSMENSEGLDETLKREVYEETGAELMQYVQLGVTSFRYPWDYLDFNYNKHIAVFNLIEDIDGEILQTVGNFDGQDSSGAVFMALSSLTVDNSSPLVMKAKEYLENKNFTPTDEVLSEWTVL